MLVASTILADHPLILFNVTELDEVLVRITMTNDDNIQASLIVFSF